MERETDRQMTRDDDSIMPIADHTPQYSALQTDGRTDRQHHDANSWSYCVVVVRLANNIYRYCETSEKCQVSVKYTVGQKCKNETLYSWTNKFHKVVRQQNSGVVEYFILCIPQFIYKSKIIEIGPHLPVIVKIKAAPFDMAHGVGVGCLP